MYATGQELILPDAIMARFLTESTTVAFVKYVDTPAKFPTALLDCIVEVDGVCYYADSTKLDMAVQLQEAV